MASIYNTPTPPSGNIDNYGQTPATPMAQAQLTDIPIENKYYKFPLRSGNCGVFPDRYSCETGGCKWSDRSASGGRSSCGAHAGAVSRSIIRQEALRLLDSELRQNPLIAQFRAQNNATYERILRNALESDQGYTPPTPGLDLAAQRVEAEIQHIVSQFKEYRSSNLINPRTGKRKPMEYLQASPRARRELLALNLAPPPQQPYVSPYPFQLSPINTPRYQYQYNYNDTKAQETPSSGSSYQVRTPPPTMAPLAVPVPQTPAPTPIATYSSIPSSASIASSIFSSPSAQSRQAYQSQPLISDQTQRNNYLAPTPTINQSYYRAQPPVLPLASLPYNNMNANIDALNPNNNNTNQIIQTGRSSVSNMNMEPPAQAQPQPSSYSQYSQPLPPQSQGYYRDTRQFQLQPQPQPQPQRQGYYRYNPLPNNTNSGYTFDYDEYNYNDEQFEDDNDENGYDDQNNDDNYDPYVRSDMYT